jgi:tight adherence protein B
MPDLSSTTLILLGIFAATALTFLLLWMLVSWWLAGRQAAVQRRIKPQEDSDPTILLDEVLLAQGQIGPGQAFHRRMKERLERTDLRLEPAEALAIIFFCGVVLAALVFFWRYEDEETWLAIPAFLVGAGIPLVYFLWRQRMWRRRIQDQLPDMFFLMARSLRAGMSIDQSIQVLGEHGMAPLSREFARMHRQLELGLALPQVLRTSAERIELLDFRIFTSVLSLQRSTGGNLAVIVDRLAHTTREHNQMRGYFRTTTAMGRVGNVIIASMILLVMFYLIFYQRDYAVRYIETTQGIILLSLGVGLVLGGVALLLYLLRTDDVM